MGVSDTPPFSNFVLVLDLELRECVSVFAKSEGDVVLMEEWLGVVNVLLCTVGCPLLVVEKRLGLVRLQAENNQHMRPMLAHCSK